MKTNLQTNEAPFSSVMTPVLAWQDVYTRNHGRCLWCELRGKRWEEMKTRRQRRDGERRVQTAFLILTGGQLQQYPTESWVREAEKRTRRERSIPGEERETYPPPPRTQPCSPVWRKTIKSTHFPLSRSVDYKWANLAFITSLQTFIKAGSPPKLQR